MTYTDEATEAALDALSGHPITRKQMAKALAAYESAMEAAGWVRVPVEATQVQHDAAREWSRVKYGKPIGFDASKGCWDAMIAARPTTEKEG